jgi:hypothetical protein
VAFAIQDFLRSLYANEYQDLIESFDPQQLTWPTCKNPNEWLTLEAMADLKGTSIHDLSEMRSGLEIINARAIRILAGLLLA